MTTSATEDDDKWSEIKLWAGLFAGIVVVTVSIVGFGTVDNLIVQEDGSIKRGSQIGGRVYHYLAPRLQGQRFWREQLIIVRERLDEETGAVERYTDELRGREQKLAKDLKALSVASGQERTSLLSIDPNISRTQYERSVDAVTKSFERDVERIVTKMNQHPEKYQRLQAIERAILKRLEK